MQQLGDRMAVGNSSAAPALAAGMRWPRASQRLPAGRPAWLWPSSPARRRSGSLACVCAAAAAAVVLLQCHSHLCGCGVAAAAAAALATYLLPPPRKQPHPVCHAGLLCMSCSLSQQAAGEAAAQHCHMHSCWLRQTCQTAPPLCTAWAGWAGSWRCVLACATCSSPRLGQHPAAARQRPAAAAAAAPSGGSCSACQRNWRTRRQCWPLCLTWGVPC